MQAPTFVFKKVRISESMRIFMNLEPDEVTTQFKMTDMICQYIKNHHLHDPRDRRIIIPNQTLRDLFNLKKDETILTYELIQNKFVDHIMK